MPLEPEKKSAEEKDPEVARREAMERALKANSQRNADQLAIRDRIADSAEGDQEHGEMQEVTDEMYADMELPENVRAARAMAKAMAEGKQEESSEESTDEEEGPKNDQREEAKDDEAREAGADDVRVNEKGLKEYRLVINGDERWMSLKEIRARAQKVENADEYLQTAVETARTAARAVPTAEEKAEAERQRQERRTRVKELLKRQALGDEQAIDDLAELIDAAPPAVTPDVLRALDERFDSRVTFREAVSWFESEYEDVLKHQAMKSYAGELDAALAAKSPQMPPRERLRRVGEQIRRELKDTFGIAQGTAGNGAPSTKAQRKAEVRRPPPAGERPRTEAGEDEAEDYSTTIQKIAQSRHQPRAVVHGPIRNR